MFDLWHGKIEYELRRCCQCGKKKYFSKKSATNFLIPKIIEQNQINLVKNLDINTIIDRGVGDIYWEAAITIWNDVNVQACYKERNRYQLPDSTK